MRKRLNVLSVVVLLVLGWSVMEAGYGFLAGVTMGFEVADEAAKAKAEGGEMPSSVSRMANMQGIHLRPSFDEAGFLTDSVYNEKSGSYVPASYFSLVVSVPPREESLGREVFSSLLAFAMLGCSLWALVLFVRIVISINRLDVFSWRNVRRLRWLGLALVLSFGIELLMAWLGVRALEEVLVLRGYTLSVSDMVERTTLVLGLCSLIVGEVFAIGLRMKEEQDLTI